MLRPPGRPTLLTKLVGAMIEETGAAIFSPVFLSLVKALVPILETPPVAATDVVLAAVLLSTVLTTAAAPTY